MRAEMMSIYFHKDEATCPDFSSLTSWKMEMIGKIPWIPTEMLRIAELLTSQGSYVSSGNRAALQAVGIVSYKNEINSYPI